MSKQGPYDVSTGYIFGYFRHLSPSWLRLVASTHGVAFPESEPFRYFELGFGQGVSLNVHAAANSGEYWGNDYIPEHVASASAMAKASGANLTLLNDSFEDLAERNDLPQFQLIVAHGIWSWVSDGNRAAILKFLDKYLAPGGLFYISYNALPGAVSGIAAQRFLHSISDSLGPSMSELDRFEIARSYLKLTADEPDSHFHQYPKAKERLAKMLEEVTPYHLHEYAVASWQPTLLLEVASSLKEVGLQFVGSSHLDAEDVLHPEHKRGIEDIVLHETMRDFSIDRSFRSDLFVRSPSVEAAGSPKERFFDQEVALTVVPNEVEIEQSESAGSKDVQGLTSLLCNLENCQKARSRINGLFGADPLIGDGDNVESIVTALNAGLIYPANASCNQQSIDQTHKLNEFLAANAISYKGKHWRASHVVGSAINCPEYDMNLLDEAGNLEALISKMILNQRRGTEAKLSAAEILKNAVNYQSRLALINALMIYAD